MIPFNFEPDLITANWECQICFALVQANKREAHRDYHEKIVYRDTLVSNIAEMKRRGLL
jgi:hypothetical protein